MPGRRRKDARTGPERIARLLKTMPDSPGVYRMIDGKGDVLYVGKARDVKKRVTSYARPTGHNNRIARMIMATADIEVVTCQTETDALLLEANLIKRLRPRYNVLLRDDKSFPYILLARDHPAPQILKHRGARKRGGDYFGPFASAGAVNRTINTLQRAFLLRSCSDSVYESRTRPCLLYQIKRCSAPCTGEISLKAYEELVHQANRFLRGQSGPVRDQLNASMQAASDQLEFERAAEYRNRLWALAHVQQHQGINPQTIEEADVFAAYQDAGQTCIQVFFFRTGQNWGNRAYFPRADKSLGTHEVLDAFLAQFYDDKPCPRLVLLSEDVPGRALLADALSLKTGRKVRVAVPRRGEKRELVLHALANAREALARRLAESANERHLLASLADTFALEEPPHRIEVYDNSHIQGSSPVGAMIVAGPDGFEKGQYRKFNIKSEAIAPGDDIAMMREVLTRRFRRLLNDRAGRNGEVTAPDKGASAQAPDMVLIDGGEGQLNVALGVLADLGICDVPVAAIAKGPDRDAGRERFFLPGRQPFMLEPRNPVLYYVQRLRDEAHRFAIGSHRARRKQKLGASPLDDIAGIGPTRKRALLQHFGSAKAVSRAGLADLKVVDGISANMAQTIYDYFHDRNR